MIVVESYQKYPRRIAKVFINFIVFTSSQRLLRADVSKYRPEVYKSERSKIVKKIHKVALGKLLTQM